MNKWTQEEAIAFESARECITDMMAIYSRQIADEARKTQPDADQLANLRTERSKLFKERASLHVNDHIKIAHIRANYGAIIRTSRQNRY